MAVASPGHTLTAQHPSLVSKAMSEFAMDHGRSM